MTTEILIYIILYALVFFSLTYAGITIFYKHRAKKSVTSLTAQEFNSKLKGGQLIDVRTPNEFSGSYIKGARNISLKKIKEKDPELIKTKPIFLYCSSGKRSKQAALLLKQRGYRNDIYELKKGLKSWPYDLKRRG